MRQCYKIKNLFGSYLYNSISPEERAEVERHVKTCHKCTEDLQTRRKALDKIGVYTYATDIPQIDQERFMWNVYKRIASETLKRRSKQVILMRYVLQPAVATLVIASIITIGTLQFRPQNYTEPSSGIPIASIQTNNSIKKEAKQIIKETERQLSKKKTTVVTAKPSNTKKTAPIMKKQEKPDVLVSNERSSNSRNWLMNADVINYSLKDPRRALSRYEMIIDYYPDTDAAQEAKKRIKSILDSEFTSQDENSNVEDMVNSGI